MALPAIIGSLLGRTAMAAEMGGASSAAASLAQVGTEVGKLGQVCGQAAPSIHAAAAMFGKVSGLVSEGLTMWVGTLKAAAGPIEALVRVHNPARVEAFTRALNDAYGVVGRLLTPVMDAFTRSARKLGDFMAGLEPVIAPAMEAVAQLVEHVTDKFIETYRKHAPVFELMADALTKFATVAMKVADVVASAIQTILKPFQFVARLLGYSGASFDPNASAVGAARREARFVGPKAISDDAIRSSLMQGIGAEKRKTPDQALNDIATDMHGLWQWVKDNEEEILGRARRNVERADAGRQSATEIAFGRWVATRTR